MRSAKVKVKVKATTLLAVLAAWAAVVVAAATSTSTPEPDAEQRGAYFKANHAKFCGKFSGKAARCDAAVYRRHYTCIYLHRLHRCRPCPVLDALGCVYTFSPTYAPSAQPTRKPTPRVRTPTFQPTTDAPTFPPGVRCSK